jgi:hypothetical protein
MGDLMTGEKFQKGDIVRVIEGRFHDQVGTVESLFENDGGKIQLVWVRLADHIDGFRPERLRRVRRRLRDQ